MIPTARARLRRLINVAPRGGALRLDELEGIHRVRVTEPDEFGGMEPGTAVVEVWTSGEPSEVLDHVEANRPAGTLVVAVVRQARLRERVGARVRWARFRLETTLSELRRRIC